ncbi:MAG: cation:proton antiporter [Phycisphaerales bacterium]|nr:cation:proton antiporter [Phycisphaerales bacterium]
MHIADAACFTLGAAQHLPLLTTIAAGFAAAWLLGLLTHKLGLSPIVGYLLAGVAIGPHTPGFTGDVALAQQLAEVGVILLMFGVGMHFHLKDLWAVKSVAIPGAIGQSLIATLATGAILHFMDWPFRSGLVLGMAMAVASTVVLLRVLIDKGMLNSSHGHVAVGWLIVEDILTVLVLVMVPVFSTSDSSAAPAQGADALKALVWAVTKLAALVAIILFAGSRVVPWILARVASQRSSELFTLTVLVLSVTIAVGSATIFGASVALGAFLAGIVVAQSPVSHQAAADALPMRDAFAVLFFVSVGMLFDPRFIVEHPGIVLAGLAVVLLIKPLAALVIVAIRGYPARTALTVAIGLAQIGEFSFILAQAARDHGLLPHQAMNVLVATAMVSITINPLLFRSLDPIERFLQRHPPLWRWLNARHERHTASLNLSAQQAVATTDKPLAVIVGYGPVGRLVDALLRDAGLHTVIVDLNIDTVRAISKAGHTAIYGDATRREVLEHAGVRKAVHLVVTLPQNDGRLSLVAMAKQINPTLEVTVRARYLAERDPLQTAGASTVVCEEGEAGIRMARVVLEKRGLETVQIDKLLTAVRSLWRMEHGLMAEANPQPPAPSA